MLVHPRPEIENLKNCPHGGPDYTELAALGLEPEEVLDFSVCCNPYPPLPAVKRALKDLEITRYPDSEATELRQAIAGKLHVATASILAGSGTTELIRLLALAYIRRGDRVLILKPTYGEYELASRLYGAEVVVQQAREEEGFRLDAEKIAGLVRLRRPRVVFICNPNNPTGQYFSKDEIDTIAGACQQSLLVLDEAYFSFADRQWSSDALVQTGNILILRSMTKDYALAGLRLGYAVAGEEIMGNLRRVCPPWNVNIGAQKAGIATLNAAGYLEKCREKMVRSRDYLIRELTGLGLPPLPTQVNFFLIKTGSGADFRKALLKQGIVVRDCASFGLPAYIRIAPRTMKECRMLIAAVRGVID